MSTLFIMYDLTTGRFVGSSLGGKFIENIAEVRLGHGRASVLGADGRNLLDGQSKLPGAGATSSHVTAEVAQAFGYEEKPAGAEDSADGFDVWDRGFRR